MGHSVADADCLDSSPVTGPLEITASGVGSVVVKTQSTSNVPSNCARRRGEGARPLPHVRAGTTDLSSACSRASDAQFTAGSVSSLKKKARRRTVSGLTKEANEEDAIVGETLKFIRE
jgi:hypothetical protein